MRNEELFTQADAARHTGAGYAKLWRALANGEVPYVRRGNRVLVRLRDVERWLAHQADERATAATAGRGR